MKIMTAFKLLITPLLVCGGLTPTPCLADQTDLSDLCASNWAGDFFKDKSFDKDHIQEGSFSLIYRASEDGTGKEGVVKFDPPLNLEEFQELKFWVYSERPTPGTITIALVSGMNEYFAYKLNTDFDGWKEVTAVPEGFKKVRDASWRNIVSIHFWDFSGNPVARDTVLYFSAIKLLETGKQ